MKWTIKLEARTGWGEVTTCEIRALPRSLGDLITDGVGMSLAEAKALLGKVRQKIVQSQIDEYVTCARVCSNCMKLRPLRNQRSRTLQTLFGPVKVAAPRIRLCACADMLDVVRQRRQAPAEIVVMINGAHLCAVPGHPNRHLDVTVGKVEAIGRLSVRPSSPKAGRQVGR